MKFIPSIYEGLILITAVKPERPSDFSSANRIAELFRDPKSPANVTVNCAAENLSRNYGYTLSDKPDIAQELRIAAWRASRVRTLIFSFVSRSAFSTARTMSSRSFLVYFLFASNVRLNW